MAKYNPEIVEEICKLISQGQTIEYTAQECLINPSTINRWLKKYPEFKRKFDNAEQHFRENCPENLQRIAQEKIKSYLENGQKITRRKKINRTLTHTIPVYTDGVVTGWVEKWKQFEHIEESDDTDLGTPQWVIDRLSPAYHIDSAIKLIESYGLKVEVADREMFESWLNKLVHPENSEEQSHKGISEDFANEIRARILGIEPENI